MPYVWRHKDNRVSLYHTWYDPNTERDALDLLYWEQGTAWTADVARRAVLLFRTVALVWEESAKSHAFGVNQIAADAIVRKYRAHIEDLTNNVEIKEIA